MPEEGERTRSDTALRPFFVFVSDQYAHLRKKTMIRYKNRRVSTRISIPRREAA
ncbi:hypothetical protein SELSPUOL_01448 [Selenomonas sputigena ATCC 35185]|uniref:Uncharacterized protein n=1 Tax=Selenomonas sputigena (strain ATCC 35185 / DSM 20758 / CCUG 44933 / VPI D19B-28) TaxID=546271 RepID=C9LVF5_SELS3|nr:hypothetical protein SELSPUOL_01448 [Selenomonas sputigena ATCC 35185]